MTGRPFSDIYGGNPLANRSNNPDLVPYQAKGNGSNPDLIPLGQKRPQSIAEYFGFVSGGGQVSRPREGQSEAQIQKEIEGLVKSGTTVTTLWETEISGSAWEGNMLMAGPPLSLPSNTPRDSELKEESGFPFQ